MSSRLFPRCAELLLVLAAAACGRDESGIAPVRSVVGDTTIVDSHVPAHPLPARLVAVTRYGALDDPGPATLGRIDALTAGMDGSVYVYDRDEGIKRFDPGGAFSDWVARAGAGPGEVRYTFALAAGPAGEIAAADLGNRRVLIVSPGGEARHVRFPDGMPRYHEDAVHYGPGSTLRIGVNPPFTAEGADPRPRLAYLGLAGDAFTDSVKVPGRIWDRCPTPSQPQQRTGFWEDQREPFIPKAVWALGGDGSMAVGCPARYELDIQRPDGTVLRIRRPNAEPVLLGSGHKRFMEEWAPVERLPEQRPAYARIILPGDGRVWVWPNQPGEAWTPSGELQASGGPSEAWRLSYRGWFDVFDPDGAWLGTVPLPEEARYSGFPTEQPVFIRGDTIWAITRDEMDVQYVTRYEVRWK